MSFRTFVTIGVALSIAIGCAPASEEKREQGATGGTGGKVGSGGAAAKPDAGGPTGGSGGSTPTFAPCTGDQATFEAFASKIESDLASQGVVGGAVAVVCGGSTIYATGLGTVEKGGAPVNAQTRFQLASVTKSLTAALAVRLAENGVVDLDDPVSKWLPHVNTKLPYDEGFTLAHLLSHTSGYPAGIDTADYSSLAGSFQQNANVALWSPPGEVFNYSNDGYALAGLVLETAAGKPFAALVEDEVMKPAGMQHASMRAESVESEGNYALGHSSWTGTVEKPTGSYYPAPYYGPMGGAWASAEDLAHFAEALINDGGALFGKASRAEMTKARTPTTWGALDYGLGLFVDDLGGTPQWGHEGSVGGFLSSFAIVPSRGLAIVILVNSDSYMPDPYAALDEAAKLFTGSALPAPTEYGAFDPASKPDHVGVYQSNTLGTIQVTDAGSELQIEIGGEVTPLSPAWRDTYFFTYQSMELDASFWRVGGTVKYVVTAYGVGARVN